MKTKILKVTFLKEEVNPCGKKIYKGGSFLSHL